MHKYLFFYSNMTIDNDSIGITKKIKSQIQAFENLGYQVYYSCYYKKGVRIMHQSDIVFEKKYSIVSPKLNRYLKRMVLLKASILFIKQNEVKFSIAYIRFHFFDRLFCKLLSTCKQLNMRTIVEAHSYPYRLRKTSIIKKLVYLRDYMFEFIGKKDIDVVLAITGQKEDVWGRPTLQMDNCINIQQYPLKSRSGFNSKCNMIFVAHEIPCHGIDILLLSMYKYFKNNGDKCRFHLNLVGNMLPSTKEYIKKYKLEEFVTLHGVKVGKELDELFEHNDIGIGVLAPHRVNSKLGTGLKTKEYMARGIPFIISGNCIKYENDSRFCLMLPYGSEHIDLDLVYKFYDENVVKHDYREMMRNKIKDYTWESQYKELFNSIEIDEK